MLHLEEEEKKRKRKKKNMKTSSFYINFGRNCGNYLWKTEKIILQGALHDIFRASVRYIPKAHLEKVPRESLETFAIH